MIVGLSNEKKDVGLYRNARKLLYYTSHTYENREEKNALFSEKNRGKNVFRHMEKSAEIIDCIHSFQKM
jgi:hypothetical protein